MAYDTAILHDVAGAGLQITPTLVTWTEVYTFLLHSDLLGADTDPADFRFALMEAYKNESELIKVGTKHKVYENAYAISGTLGTVTRDDTTNLRQTVNWAMPGDYSSVEYDSFEQSENRSFSEDNNRGLIPYNLCAVPYAPSNLNPTQTNFQVPFVASIRIPAIAQAARITQWESRVGDNASPDAIMGYPRPFWNKDGIWGCKPGELLFLGCKSSTEGTPLHRRTYYFRRGIYGFHHYFALYNSASGVTPGDITPINPAEISAGDPSKVINGAAAFKMLPSRVFAEEFKHLKLPFNQGPSPNDANPSAGGVGDFPPMPDNLA